MDKNALLKLSENMRTKTVLIDGGEYTVKELNAKEYAEYQASLYKVVGQNIKVDAKNAKITLFILSLLDDEGNPMFTMADFEAVGKLPSRVVDKVADAAESLITGEDDAVKN